MQHMRYINLFRKTCHVSTTNCFVYNNTIVFAIPNPLVSKALGKNGENIRKLALVLRKKIKVISMPKNNEGIKKFVENVVSPVTFTNLELKDGGIVISAGRQSKAALIGRNRLREKELQDILGRYFGIRKLRIM